MGLVNEHDTANEFGTSQTITERNRDVAGFQVSRTSREMCADMCLAAVPQRGGSHQLHGDGR